MVEWTDVATACAAIATAGFTFGLLVTAYCALSAAKKTWKATQASADAAAEMNRQVRLDSRAQTRPYVTAQIIPGLAGPTTWDLKITNTGRTAARNLTMDYDQWPNPDHPEAWDEVSRSLHTMFTTPRTLAPGASLRVIWLLDRGPDENPNLSDPPMGLGKEGTLSVRYGSDDPQAPIYSDSYEVLVNDSGLTPVPEDGPNLLPGSGLDKPQKRLDKLMRVLIRRIGELGR